MARLEVLKRIKDDVLIENRIQIYRIHFTYLKTCLKYAKEFKVDKSKYNGWKLDEVKSLTFDKWWSSVGRDLMGKKLDTIRQIKTSSFNPRPNNTVLEIPNDTPTEYVIEKIREILNSSKVRQKKEKRIHHLKLEIYLESWLLKKQNLKIKEIRRRLVAKRKLLSIKFTARQKKALAENKKFKQSIAMNKWATKDFLKFKANDPNGILSLERQVNRYKNKAKQILVNVSNGEFPGDYTE